MRGGRPFQTRVVVRVPPHRLVDAAGWARLWTEAGADGLALEADPGDALATALLGALRRHSSLPLEVQAPDTATPSPEWGPALAACEVDWLLPSHAPDDATAEAWAESGPPWAWPLLAGPAPEWISRLHARGSVIPGDWGDGPDGAERSLSPDPEGPPPAFGDSAADTLILPEKRLEGLDPAAVLASLRP
ncbi:hypothetical protein [Thiohalorhabdus sp.]|uniref:hypothetical protein n=1 Tax=Thiohalorhabdus sp. TaxID=3094134 RepID=UPI002FC305A8